MSRSVDAAARSRLSGCSFSRRHGVCCAACKPLLVLLAAGVAVLLLLLLLDRGSSCSACCCAAPRAAHAADSWQLRSPRAHHSEREPT